MNILPALKYDKVLKALACIVCITHVPLYSWLIIFLNRLEVVNLATEFHFQVDLRLSKGWEGIKKERNVLENSKTLHSF